MASLLCPRVSRVLLSPVSSSSFSWTMLLQAPCLPSRRRDEALRPRTRQQPQQQQISRRSLWSLTKKGERVVIRYEELPRDYRDSRGLAFWRRDLYLGEVRRIFGPDMDTDEGNRLLRILHGRRVAGTLEDPALSVHTARFTAQQLADGLAYLRKTVSVDEVLSAGLRAEDELKLMELEAEKKKPVEKQEAADKEEVREEETTTDGVYKPDPVYGRSILDEIRARNIAKRKAREKALEEERQAARTALGDGSVDVVPVTDGDSSRALSDRPREFRSAKLAKYYEEAQSPLKEPPRMTAWQRIMPSAAVALLTVGLLVGVCAVYEEPTAQYRLFREISASQATLATLVAINVAVFACWRVPPLWKTFNKYMILVVGKPRAAAVLTSVFSHISLVHLVLNMVPLWFVGTRLHDDLDRAEFLTLYVGCGVMGFLSSLVAYTMRGMLVVSTLGSSGATLGVLSAYLWEARREGFRMFGLPREGVHGVVLLGLLTAVQLGGLCRASKYKVDFVSHLMGMATGVAGMELIIRKREAAAAAARRNLGKPRPVEVERGTALKR
ncbi:rhomboid family protein [Ophiocordyceps camponoti-floridani]|uniref:Rhomboid family protein n=1 Tax=Ophiocordyceps camponoti-floridani TaxID=2030778 RepID=A0A8H4VG48_9HYPO|nr:rhomboid family protein [Ophiocordyceps camponoti-floridani]